jgi:DtxR family Mn-dependent transcriptional regulator
VAYSHTEENYLKAIYHLQVHSETVSTNHLAQQLQTKPASVTDMMKKLQSKGLLHYKPYYGFSLSTEGRKAALHIVRRHRLWESFLAEKLHFGWHEVHEVAEELEHVGNKKLIEQLDAYLGYPQFDPHGDPIPDSKGKISTVKEAALNSVPARQAFVVTRIRNQSADMLQLLHHLQIQIGTRLEVVQHFPYDGSLQVLADNIKCTISAQLADNIMMRYEINS